jgi:hypothetical protein
LFFPEKSFTTFSNAAPVTAHRGDLARYGDIDRVESDPDLHRSDFRVNPVESH